jgi:hypothetical protein
VYDDQAAGLTNNEQPEAQVEEEDVVGTIFSFAPTIASSDEIFL